MDLSGWVGEMGGEFWVVEVTLVGDEALGVDRMIVV